MHSELIIMTISEKEAQNEARRILNDNQGAGIFEHIDIVFIQQDSTGKIIYEMPWEDNIHSSDNRSRLAIGFAELFFEPSREEDRRQLAEAGLDRFFMRKLSNILTPDNFACMFYLPNDRLIDSRSILEILDELQGYLYHTIFHPQVEEVLLNKDH